MLEEYKKIIIIGNGGSGKSTLGETLSKKLNLPVYHLDRLTFNEGWIRVGEKEFTEKLNDILSKDNWIVEGWSYNSTVKMRLHAADLIIYLEFSVWFCYWNALKRHLRYTFKQNPYDPPNSNVWKKTIRMVKAIWLVHKVYEPQLKNLLPEYERKKKVIRVNKRKFAHALYQ